MKGKMRTIDTSTVSYFVRVLDSCKDEAQLNLAHKWIVAVLCDTFDCDEFESEGVLIEIYRRVMIRKLW